ncbi:hypothetical protein PIB30_006796 [Stylosanthes scabra]|uniref:Uncharacterized protein n=1 Tax=Stylosanthes scabra TaxID=79078 RepID=A0ABU6U4B5_9FABA|nr:hypothetical protein [Stylosanthes scabra]
MVHDKKHKALLYHFVESETNPASNPQWRQEDCVQDINEERAIILYKLDAEPPAAYGSTTALEENSNKKICECSLAPNEDIDLNFEAAFSLFLLGQGPEVDAVEKLKQLELNSNPKHSSVFAPRFKRKQ